MTASPSTCVIGNSSHIKGKGLGRQIDSHDIVVRKGWFGTDQEDFGKKITDWYIGSWEIFNFSEWDGKNWIFIGEKGKERLFGDDKRTCLEEQIEFFASCEGEKNIYTFGGGTGTNDLSLPVDTYNKFKDAVCKKNKKGSIKFYGDGTQWLSNLSLTQPFPDIRCTSIFLPHETAATTGLYILMKYLADSVTEKQKKINIAGFGFGGDKQASGELEEEWNPTHSPITEWKIIDMLIDVGRVNNLEKGYVYR